MRKVCYSVAMSLDGYVAGPNGEADWIVMDPEIDFMALFDRFDTIVMGRKTYELASGQGQGPAMPGITSYVVSTTLRQEEHPDVTIISGDLGQALKEIRAKPGKDIWLFGGGVLFRSLLEIGQVDRVETAIVPVLLGSGVPLLPTMSLRSKLKLENTRIYKTTGIVSLEYTVER